MQQQQRRQEINISPLEIAEGKHLGVEATRYPVGLWYKGREKEVTINYDEVIPEITVGSVPVTKVDMNLIKKEGFGALLDLCTDQENEARWAKERGIEFLSEYVHDGHTPTQAQYHRITEWIDEQIRAGRKVYIHCHAGAGRAPTVTTAYLVRYRGMTTDEALEVLREKRRHHIVSRYQVLGLRTFENTLSA